MTLAVVITLSLGVLAAALVKLAAGPAGAGQTTTRTVTTSALALTPTQTTAALGRTPGTTPARTARPARAASPGTSAAIVPGSPPTRSAAGAGSTRERAIAKKLGLNPRTLERLRRRGLLARTFDK